VLVDNVHSLNSLFCLSLSHTRKKPSQHPPGPVLQNDVVNIQVLNPLAVCCSREDGCVHAHVQREKGWGLLVSLPVAGKDSSHPQLIKEIKSITTPQEKHLYQRE
jgi:hypothetical protein